MPYKTKKEAVMAIMEKENVQRWAKLGVFDYLTNPSMSLDSLGRWADKGCPGYVLKHFAEIQFDADVQLKEFKNRTRASYEEDPKNCFQHRSKDELIKITLAPGWKKGMGMSKQTEHDLMKLTQVQLLEAVRVGLARLK
jgi:hypothetical protein